MPQRILRPPSSKQWPKARGCKKQRRRDRLPRRKETHGRRGVYVSRVQGSAFLSKCNVLRRLSKRILCVRHVQGDVRERINKVRKGRVSILPLRRKASHAKIRAMPTGQGIIRLLGDRCRKGVGNSLRRLLPLQRKKRSNQIRRQKARTSKCSFPTEPTQGRLHNRERPRGLPLYHNTRKQNAPTRSERLYDPSYNKLSSYQL